MARKPFRIDVAPIATPWGPLNVTVKEMSNREVRYRMKMPDGSTAHYTVMGDSEPEWQEAHFHKDLDEVYTVASGLIAVAIAPPSGDPEIRVYRARSTIIIPAGVQHNVLPFRNAAFHTHTSGAGVQNPERKGDWWPATVEFSASCWEHTAQSLLA
jgi:mannose-6-phosphate isomerase-like protein (cupin superfamily)